MYEILIFYKSWLIMGNVISNFIVSINLLFLNLEVCISIEGIFIWKINKIFFVKFLKMFVSDIISGIIIIFLVVFFKEENKVIIVGFSIVGVVVLILVVFIIIILLKWCNLFCI